MEFVFAVLAIIAVIIIVAFAVFAKNKKKKTNLQSEQKDLPENQGFLPNESEKDISPVTADLDVEISFDGIGDSFAEELLEHTELASAATAIKPEIAARLYAENVKKPEKPKISAKKYLEEITVMTDNPSQGTNKVAHIIKSFFAGEYYIDGTMINGGEKTPLEMGMKGNDFHVFSELDGKDLAVMQLEDKTYLLNPDTKKYTELNASVKKMMGITDQSFSFSFSKIKFDADCPSSVTQAVHKGNDAVCYTYKNEDNHLDFIAVDDAIVQIIVYGGGGEPETVLELDEFFAQIPEEMFNFKGYHKTNMISFLTAMM